MALDHSRRFLTLSSSYTNLLKVFVALLTAYLVFVLPYSFPPHTRLVSPSYVFGFNNRLAILSLGVTTLLLAVLELRSAPISLRLFTDHPRATGWYRNRTLMWLYGAAALTYLAITLVIYFGIAKSDGYYKLDWESSQFLWRTRLMMTYGLQPYRDFVAEYGPALVYLPEWSGRLLQPFGISVEAAYYVLHYLLNLIGLAALLYLTDSFSISLRAKRTAFILVALSAFSEMMGLNGLLIRFILPYVSLLLVHRATGKAAAGNKFWRLYLLIAATSVANIAVSPDIGVEWFLGLAVYTGFVFRVQSGLAVRMFLSEFVVLAISPLVLPVAYFHTLVSFSQGGNNFPIVPALHIVFYLLVFLLCVPRFLAIGWLERNLQGACVAGMGALCLAALPAALGRCDPPHVILNGFGLFTLSFAVFAQGGLRRFATYTAVYVAIAIFAFQYSNAKVYGVSPSYVRAGVTRLYAFLERLGRKAEPNTGASTQSAGLPPNVQQQNAQPYAGFEKYRRLGLPYGSYGYEKSLQRYLWANRQVAPERYMGTVAIYNEQHLAERLDDLGHIRYLVVQKNFLRLFENRDLCSELRSYLKSSFLYFTAPPCTQPVFEPNVDLARFVYQHYRVIDQINDYLILERKN